MTMLEETSPKKIKGRWILDTEVKLNNFLFQLIKDKGPVTRGELSKLTNIPRTTLYDYIIEFVRANKIEKYPVSTRKRGRPLIYYRIVQ